MNKIFPTDITLTMVATYEFFQIVVFVLYKYGRRRHLSMCTCSGQGPAEEHQDKEWGGEEGAQGGTVLREGGGEVEAEGGEDERGWCG